MKRRLGRIWNAIETSDIEMADASDRIKEALPQDIRDTVEPRFHDIVLGWYGGNAINQSISTISMPPEDFLTGQAKISLLVAKIRAKAGKEE